MTMFKIRHCSICQSPIPPLFRSYGHDRMMQTVSRSAYCVNLAGISTTVGVLSLCSKTVSSPTLSLHRHVTCVSQEILELLRDDQLRRVYTEGNVDGVTLHEIAALSINFAFTHCAKGIKMPCCSLLILKRVLTAMPGKIITYTHKRAQNSNLD